MSATILIVDDNVPQRRSLRVGLEVAGFNVVESATAQDALIELAHRPVDFAILDAMVAGESGLELSRRFRFRHPRLPLLLTSSSRLPRDQMAALTPNVLACVPKPYNLGELTSFLQRVLDTAATG